MTRAPPRSARMVCSRGSCSCRRSGRGRCCCEALALDPDLKAEAYPPSIQQFLSDAREKLPGRVTMTIEPEPQSAEVRIDGRPLAAGIAAVIPGKHQIAARATGFRLTTLRVTATKDDQTVAIALTPAFAPPIDAALSRWISEGSKPAADLAGMAAHAGVQRIVVLTLHADLARAGLLGAGEVRPWLAADDRAIAEWVRGAIAPAPLVAQAPSSPSPALAPAPHPLEPKKKPLTKRPLFWAAVGVGGLLVLGGIAAATGNSPLDAVSF